MSSPKEIGRQALRAALEIRQRVSAPNSQPICVYDVAETLGIEVVFRPESSLGGLYNKTSETILVPSYRPPGRQAFTCAHEIGHWFFGHGTSIDEENGLDQCYENESEESLVDIFASYLLMPPWAVRETYRRRGWSANHCTPLQAYTISGQLGVGYETLIHHLSHSLHLISPHHAQYLLRTTPKQLRCSLLGCFPTRHLVIVDNCWNHVALDLRVGDHAIVPANVRLEGRSVAFASQQQFGHVIEARQPGISRAESHDQSWAVFIRVSREHFIGRSIYRHLEDPDVNGNTGSDI
jgi:Zn-dependent peptidase ImmA (M78 family)